FATRNAAVPAPAGIQKVLYRLRAGASAVSHPCSRGFENSVGHALGVYEALKAQPDIRPDLLVAHSGFGSSLFLPCLYDAPILNFFEYFFDTSAGDFGYRPEVAGTESKVLRLRTVNAMTLHDLRSCEQGWSASFYDGELFP